MLRLRTFGGISVLDDAGEPIPGALAQRRPIALLAILAASHRAGLTRDKIAGLLWPDADSDRARHSLTQTLYSARRSLGVDDLFLTEGSIRLNDSRISSDVADLERALDAGDLKAAVGLYDGSFLDGFFISGASEFEPWVAARRNQIEERVIGALDRLASNAERAGDDNTALRLRKRQTTIRPLDSGIVLTLVALLARTGNRAEALRHAQVHTSLVHDQLDLPPDPQLEALVRKLRDAPTAPSPVANREETTRRWPGRTDPVTHSESEAGSSDVVQSPLDRQSHQPIAGARRRRFRRAVPLAALGAAVLIGATTWRYLVASRDDHQGAAPISVRPGSLVVVPFNVSGASPSAAYIGKAVAQLLGPRLQLDSIASAADAGAVFTAWRSRGFELRTDPPRDSVLRFARDLGARRLVVGSVVGDRARAILSAVMLDVPTGENVARATVEGPAETLGSLVHQLAAKLLVAEAGAPESLAVRSEQSLGALQQYVAGRLADRSSDWAASIRKYSEALTIDSTFSTAALRLAVAADRSGNAEIETSALHRAWRHREQLDQEDQTLLTSFVGPRYPLPSTRSEQLAAWEQVARDRARSPAAWQQLAAHLFHEGGRLGVPANSEAASALDRSLSLDHDYAPAKSLHLAMADSSNDGDSSLTTARAVAMASQWRGRRVDQGVRAVELLASMATTQAEQIDAVLAEHSLALNRGRISEALAATTRLRQLRPDSHGFLRLRVVDALYGGGDAAAAAAAVRDLEQPTDSVFDDFPLAQRRRDADGCVVSQWRLAHHDTTGVRSTIELLRHAVPRREPALVSALPGACAELLDASFAVVANEPGALSRVEHLDSLMLTPAVAGDAAGYSHLLVASLYARLGHPRRALAALRQRDDMIGWPAYLSATWHEEWRLAVLVGDASLASKARRNYSVWRGTAG